MAIAYRAARVIDGVSDEPLENAAVIVEGSRIVSVEKTVPAGIDVVDLRDATLMPGLIDAHVHLVWNASAEPHAVVDRESRYMTVLRCANNCALHIRAGVTAVRDAGSTDAMALDLGRATELGLIPGPRVIAAGRVIAMTGGHAWVLGREADGVDAVRHAARAELKAGAHFVKLMASGGVYGHGEEVGSPQLTVEEMRAGVDEAHRMGKKASSHAYSPRAIGNSLDAGMDCIEHGSFVDAPTAERMKGQGAYLVPTLSVYQLMYDTADALGSPDYIKRKTAEVMEASRGAFRLAMATGVKIAAGTDCGAPGHTHGVAISEEIRLMAELGATPMHAIQMATAAAADLLGIVAETGTLEPGKAADLLAVEGNPLRDIRALKAVKLVVKGGTVM